MTTPGGVVDIDDGALHEDRPFSHFEDNKLTGFDYDIAVAIADEMGLDLQTKTGAFDTLPHTNREEVASSEVRSLSSRTRFAPDVIDRTRRQR